jgi:hypothetical protein
MCNLYECNNRTYKVSCFHKMVTVISHTVCNTVLNYFAKRKILVKALKETNVLFPLNYTELYLY